MIVGFGYEKRSGKDTAGRRLVEHHGFRRLAFADRLKAAGALICGFSEEQCHGALKDVADEFWGFTPGWFFQQFGTEVCRVIDPDTWVKVVARVLAKTPLWVNVVLTDVRYPNEADLIRRAGGFVVRVDRPGLERRAGEEAGRRSGDHTSERALVGYNFDAVLLNDGTLAELDARVDAMLADLTRREVGRAGGATGSGH